MAQVASRPFAWMMQVRSRRHSPGIASASARRSWRKASIWLVRLALKKIRKTCCSSTTCYRWLFVKKYVKDVTPTLHSKLSVNAAISMLMSKVGWHIRSGYPDWGSSASTAFDPLSSLNRGGYKGSGGYVAAKSFCSLGLPVPTGEAGDRSHSGTAGTGKQGRTINDYVFRQLGRVELLGRSGP